MATLQRWTGVLIITVGLLLLGQVLHVPFVSFARWWPLSIIIPGFAFFSRRGSGPFGIHRILGSICTVLGLYFLFEVWTGWSTATQTAWMYPLSAAIGFFLASEGAPAHRSTLRVMMWLCVAASAIIISTLIGTTRYWPMLCIVVGLIIIGKPKRFGSGWK